MTHDIILYLIMVAFCWFAFSDQDLFNENKSNNKNESDGNKNN